jgi:hypothetical protein
MKIHLAKLAAFALLAAIATGACSGDDDSSQPAGAGTEPCRSYQLAYCSLGMKCQAPALVCDQAKSVACKSDAEAQRCATALSASSCAAPPSGCDLSDIADPAPAKKACEDFQAAICQRSEECMAGSHDMCVEEIKAAVNCANAIGVKSTFQSCLSETRILACDATEAPEACKGVLLMKAGSDVGELHAPLAEHGGDLELTPQRVDVAAQGGDAVVRATLESRKLRLRHIGRASQLDLRHREILP